jgi:hypothetical protein
MRRRTALPRLLIPCLLGTALLYAEAPRELRPFLEKHCVDCHDAENAKGGLDFGKLSSDLNQPETLAKWVRVFDRVDQGEMPPKKKARPEAGALAAFTKTLATSLTEADRAHKATVLRRLNRNEFEQTLNDLLGINEELAPLLPEDGRAQGFDKVGEALDLSSVHLQRAMDAARQALNAAMNKGEAPTKVDQTIAFDAGRNAQHIGKSWHKLADGSVVTFNEATYPALMAEFEASTAGLYRVTLRGRAYQTDKPIMVTVFSGPFGAGTPTRLQSVQEFSPAGDEVQIEVQLKARDKVRLFPDLRNFDYNLNQKLGPAKYPGAGLAMKPLRVEGPLLPQWPGAGHKLLFGDLPNAPASDWARRIKYEKRRTQQMYEVTSTQPGVEGPRLIKAFVDKVVREKSQTTQADPYVRLFEAELKNGSTFEESLLTAYTAVLCSPANLYFHEQAGRLDAWAVASRLSYMFWGTAPDDELRKHAETGALLKPATLRAQTDRLLSDRRAQRFVRDFTDQWLSLRNIDTTTPDKQLYPEYDDALKAAMLAETRGFFTEVLTKNLSVTDFLDSDWTILNNRLARHYDIPGVDGVDFRKVALKPEYHRGGLLTHASVLKVSANGNNTSPVVRGAWVLDRILGTPPSPPPPGTPGVEPDIRGATTLRQMLEKHRSTESCNSCHAQIDPPGFALESYDVAGGWQTNYRSLGRQFKSPPNLKRIQWRIGPPVDSSGVTADGKAFADLKEFKQKVLLADPEAFTLALARKLAAYGSGRAMGFSDRVELRRIAHETFTHGNGLRDLLHNLVQSEIFLTK